MQDRDDLDSVFRESIHDNVREPFHQVSTSSKQVVAPKQGRALNRNTGDCNST